jgi:uncharacterized protein YqgQ
MIKESEVWDIVTLSRVRQRVCFDKAVTAEEAEELFMHGIFEDVIDEEYLSTESILNVE